MATDAEITIAFLFKRSGKNELKKSELYLPLSIELNWFSPQEAKDFVKLAIKQKILEEKEGMVKPSFNIEQVKIPVGFQPSKQLLDDKEFIEEKEEKNLIELLIEKICKNSEPGKQIIIEKIKKIEQEKNITPEIAALLIGKEYDVVLEEFYKKIEKETL